MRKVVTSMKKRARTETTPIPTIYKESLTEFLDAGLNFVTSSVTFRSCSKQFDQLYIIHGEVQIFSSKVRLPLVYVLMPDRKTEIYDHVFKTLIDKCTELFGVRLKPS